MELNQSEVIESYGPVSELYHDASGKLTHYNMELHFV